MKTLEEHMSIYRAQNGARPFTPKQRRRLFQTYRCRKCGAFGQQPCRTPKGAATRGFHLVRPA